MFKKLEKLSNRVSEYLHNYIVREYPDSLYRGYSVVFRNFYIIFIIVGVLPLFVSSFFCDSIILYSILVFIFLAFFITSVSLLFVFISNYVDILSVVVPPRNILDRIAYLVYKRFYLRLSIKNRKVILRIREKIFPLPVLLVLFPCLYLMEIMKNNYFSLPNVLCIVIELVLTVVCLILFIFYYAYHIRLDSLLDNIRLETDKWE